MRWWIVKWMLLDVGIIFRIIWRYSGRAWLGFCVSLMLNYFLQLCSLIELRLWRKTFYLTRHNSKRLQTTWNYSIWLEIIVFSAKKYSAATSSYKSNFQFMILVCKFQIYRSGWSSFFKKKAILLFQTSSKLFKSNQTLSYLKLKN